MALRSNCKTGNENIKVNKMKSKNNYLNVGQVLSRAEMKKVMGGSGYCIPGYACSIQPGCKCSVGFPCCCNGMLSHCAADVDQCTDLCVA